MAINPNVSYPTKTNAPSSDYPYGSARNVIISGDGTGTPFEQDTQNDWWGLAQQLLSASSITPSGNPDKVGASDYYDAIRRTAGYPGSVQWTAIQQDPAVLGIRLLRMEGQVLTIANYPDLVDATYVGDANNAAALYFFKASDALGSVRDTSGPYFKIPEARGRFLRAIDPTGVLDVDRGANTLTDFQNFATYDHRHAVIDNSNNPFRPVFRSALTAGTDTEVLEYYPTLTGALAYTGSIRDPYPGTGVVSEISTNETRPGNLCFRLCIWY